MTFNAISATLTTRTPLHIGTGRDTATSDDLLRRDASGRLLIPGTALAGALRGIATRLAPRLGSELCAALKNEDSKPCNCWVCQLFGTVNLPDEDQDERGPGYGEAKLPPAHAANLLIYDAVLASQPTLSIRDGVGIDRVTGAAARRERSKFDLEVVPAGEQFVLRIEITGMLDDNARYLLAATLAEWKAGRGAVGGRISRGLGAFTLINVHFIHRDLNNPTELMQFLRAKSPWDLKTGDATWLDTTVVTARQNVHPITVATAHTSVARSWASAEFTLEAKGPFLTHDLAQAGRSGFDHAPVKTRYTLDAPPVLPGSSLRGTLRSHAERIARTIATFEASRSKDSETYFKQHCPACNPLTTKTEDEIASCNSFIKAKISKHERDQLERQGADDKLCLACRLFGSTWNGSRLRIEDAPLKAGTPLQIKVLDFLAIDRFTGGGRDSAKFDAVVLWRPQFSVRILLENPEPWELGWLALVLRDLHEQRIAVGFGRSKGFGQCHITDPSVTIGLLHENDFPAPAPTDHNKAIAIQSATQRLLAAARGNSGVYQTILYRPELQTDWLMLANGWVEAFNRQIKDHCRPDAFELQHDSYFGTVDALYKLQEPA